MEKLKCFKNRLSISIDRFPSRTELQTSESLLSEGNSTCSSGYTSGVTQSENSSSLGNDIIWTHTNSDKRSVVTNIATDSSVDSLKEFSEVLKTATSNSLMDEVMKEVDKISDDSTTPSDSIPPQIRHSMSTLNPLTKSNDILKNVTSDVQDKLLKNDYRSETIVCSQNSDDSKIGSPVDNSDKKNSSVNPVESITSEYYSESASQEVSLSKKQKKERANTMSPLPKLFNFGKDEITKDNANNSKISLREKETNGTAKRESIYSRIVKSTKRDGSVTRSTKEPLYARIKPKIFGDSIFKPIDPNRTKGVKTTVIRPEPWHPNEITVDNVTEDVPQPSELSTTKITSSRSTPIPIDSGSKTNNTLDRPLSNHRSQVPLSSLPKELSSEDCSFSEDVKKEAICSKFIVRSSQIIPSKPNIINISNPGYAKSKFSITNKNAVSDSMPTVCSLRLHNSEPMSQNKNLNDQRNVTNVALFEEKEVRKDSNTSQIQEEMIEKSKLNRLVEELAQELESVSRRTGIDDIGNEDSKREVLMRLLSNYDLPKPARPVTPDRYQLSDSFHPTSISSNELRYVDDTDGVMVYGDIPDYSQDEFFIALDDENNPKYATLTKELNKYEEEDSSDRVSHRSTQMYSNVVNVLSALKFLINSNSTKAATVISRMGTIARPYTEKVNSSINDTTWIQRKLFHLTGHNGFDELRRYIKSGGEFCKELAVIMHERAELESNYAKGLHKLSTKLLKSSRDSLGTISEAWQAVGSEFEHEGDVHRIFAASLTDEVVRPLRQIIESQYKVRKGVEGIVDKSTRNLQDWRTAEVKAKKTSFHNTRESEKVQDMLIDARLHRGKVTSEKDIFKLEKQRKKAEDSVKKSDLEYYNFCVRAERSRQDWESAIYKGSNCFQTLEEERLKSLQELVKTYHKTRMDCTPKIVANAERLKEPVSACDVEKDIQTIITAKGSGENLPEQNLPDFFAEDFNNAMNKTRRREALQKFIGYIRTDLERERKGKQGVENLAKALQETPKFGGEDSKQDVNDKLQHMKAMLAYLEAARYKVQSSLEELDSRPRSMHPLAKHIDVRRDKQGYPTSILKFPAWEKGGSTNVSPLSESPDSSPNWNDRGTADGNSVQPDSDFVGVKKRKDNLKLTVKPMPAAHPKAFMYPYRYPSINLPTDEFSSQGSDHDYQNAVNDVVIEAAQPNGDLSGESPQNYSISPIENMPDGTYYARPLTIPSSPRCKALYDYEANLYDELTIRIGDIINIHEKQPDGWWLGELEGVVGIFPATYVEAIDYP